jgi:hypothetical protein
MPAVPAVERGREIADDGGEMEVVSGAVITRDMVLGFRVLTDMAGLIGHPLSDGALIDLVDEQAGGGRPTQQSEPELRNQAEVSYRGFLGREGVIVDPNQRVISYVRALVGKYRIYVLVAVMNAYDEARYAGYARAFFESVTLDPRDATEPVGDGTLDLNAWRYVYPADGGFAVSMPGAPRYEEVSLTDGQGTYPVKRYVVGAGMHSYEIYEVRVGRAPREAMIDVLRDRIAAGGLTIQSQRDVQRQGFAGRAVVFTAPDRTVESRFYLTRGRLYELRASSPAGTLEQTAAFFDSFRIL